MIIFGLNKPTNKRKINKKRIEWKDLSEEDENKEGKIGEYIGMIRDGLNENARGSSLKNYIFFSILARFVNTT